MSAGDIVKEGSVVRLFPGYIWNSFREEWLRLVSKDEERTLFVFPNETIANSGGSPTGVIRVQDIGYPIVASKGNELVFSINAKSDEQKKIQFFYKVTTDREERDKWVQTLMSFLPKPEREIPREVKKSGTVTQLFPGRIYNDFREVHLRVLEGENSSIGIFVNESAEHPMERIPSSDLVAVTESSSNDLIFKVIVQKSDAPQTNSVFYFKVLNKDERHQWALSLNYMFLWE